MSEKIEINGATIQTYTYPTEKPAKANVFFMHSQHDYAGRYAYMAKSFAEKGIQFNAMDNRGHGGSISAVVSIDQMAKDQHVFHEITKKF